MTDFADRFAPERYEHDEPVTVTTNGAGYDIPERLFARAQQLAAAYELHLLPSINIYERTTFNQLQCVTLADELAFLRSIISDPLLNTHLDQLRALTERCRGSEATLTIEGL
jgi:hypothetical protein